LRWLGVQPPNLNEGRAADQEYGGQDGRMSAFAACTS
jgi:hypothetical protein